MTYTENRQRIKSEALNAIAKIYNSKTKNPYSIYFTEDGSHADQRDSWCHEIIENMHKELRELKLKHKTQKF